MRFAGVLLSLVAAAASATAQESRWSRSSANGLPSSLSEEEQQQKDQEKVVKVAGTPLQDELPHGETNKPMWSDHRPSPTTRIYLQVDSGEVEFEQWLDIRIPKDTAKGSQGKQVRLSEEFEFGLGGRFQLDLYYNSIFEGSGSTSTLDGRSWAAEIRYALADWGVIWGNPTLYLEYIMWNNGGNGHGDEAAASIEPKLLLGGDIAPAWHWGVNFFYEHTFNDSVLEMGATGTIFVTVVDKYLNIGATVKTVYESDELAADPANGHPSVYHERSRELYFGPSFQVRMASYNSTVMSNGVETKVTKTRAHLDLEPLFGLTGDSKRAQILIIFGWDF